MSARRERRDGGPLRVTVLSSLPPQKGITPYTLHLLRSLAARDDVRVRAIGFRSLYPRSAYPGGAPEHSAAETEAPVPAERVLDWYNPFTWVLAGLRLRGDVLHAQWWSWFLAPAYATVLALAKFRGVLAVVTVHNARPHEGGGWKRRLNDLIIRQADHLIVHCERNREALTAAGIARGRISVVPMGAHTLAPSRPLSRAEARAALGLPAQARVVTFFGNQRRYKGIDVLVSAAAIARRRLSDLHVVIAGERWKDCPDPRAQAEGLGIADIVHVRDGYVPEADIASLFAATDVVVLPYVRFDGQSAAGALALSSGRAMVVSDCGGLPDLVRDPRAVVPPSDAQALAHALVDVLTDPALRRTLEAGSASVRDELSWERVADRTVETYRRLLGLDDEHAQAQAKAA